MAEALRPLLTGLSAQGLWYGHPSPDKAPKRDAWALASRLEHCLTGSVTSGKLSHPSGFSLWVRIPGWPPIEAGVQLILQGE